MVPQGNNSLVTRDLALSQSARLAAVQAPVIPIVGRWTAETPGTISLGQGIVSYGPPPEVMQAVAAFGSTLGEHRYGPVEGSAELVGLIEAKLARENGITVRPASRLFVTAGGNQAFVNAVLAVTDPGDEVILPAPFYFNHEMAVVIAGAVPVGVPTTREYQLDVAAIAAGDDAADPGDRHGVAQQPHRGGLSRAGPARGQPVVPRSRRVPRPRRGLRVLRLRAVAALLARLDCRCGPPHHFALLAVEGLRDGELAGRLHGGARPACGRPSTRFRTRS